MSSVHCIVCSPPHVKSLSITIYSSITLLYLTPSTFPSGNHITVVCAHEVSFFLKDFIYLFLDRGEGREEERERNITVVVSCMPCTGDLTGNPGMCSDWELNQRPFGSQAHAQSTEHTSQGLSLIHI